MTEARRQGSHYENSNNCASDTTHTTDDDCGNRTNCRIITATNKNLQEEINGGKFREDLFYRLSVINLKLPPLRERRDDITFLAEYFIQFFNVW